MQKTPSFQISNPLFCQVFLLLIVYQSQFMCASRYFSLGMLPQGVPAPKQPQSTDATLINYLKITGMAP